MFATARPGSAASGYSARARLPTASDPATSPIIRALVCRSRAALPATAVMTSLPGEDSGRAGTPVQPGHHPRLGTRQLQAQQIAEQMVVAEPLATAVEGNQEQVRTLNLLQPGDPVRPARDRVTDRGAQPLQDRGAQQELAQ